MINASSPTDSTKPPNHVPKPQVSRSILDRLATITIGHSQSRSIFSKDDLCSRHRRKRDRFCSSVLAHLLYQYTFYREDRFWRMCCSSTKPLSYENHRNAMEIPAKSNIFNVVDYLSFSRQICSVQVLRNISQSG